jgi:hypothetical protein
MSKKKKKISQYFDEAYTIKATYQEDDGLWKKIVLTQTVPVKHGINEKCNHDRAKKLFLEQNRDLKNLEVISVIYQ